MKGGPSTNARIRDAFTVPQGTDRVELDLNNLNDVEHISSASDLPDAAGGTHTLDDLTAYMFDGFVTSSDALELGNASPLLAPHGGVGGFIYTGGSGAAIRGTDAPFFARDALFGAPGADMFNLSGDQSTEMLVESCSFSDAANLGNIASLGTISGYRVPTFKGCNFEDFDGGLTFDGSPDKIFVEKSPLRGVTASNVSIFTLADTCDVSIVDFPGNYVKDVQSDTEVWRVEAGGEPTEVFQYRGTTHDTSVTKSNILTGPNASLDVEPFWVTQSYPLRASGVIGEMHNTNAASTVTITTADTWTDVNIASILDRANRVEKDSEGHQQYVGSKDVIAEVNINISFYGANGDIFTWGVGLNNNDPLTQHTGSIEGRGKNANLTIPVNAVFELVTNDVVHLKVKNESSTNDPTILSYSFGVSGQ